MGSIGLVLAFVLPALAAGVIAGSLTGRRLLYAIGLLAAVAWYPLYAEKGVQAPLVRAYAVIVPLGLVTVGFIARASRRE
jgi:hypothetical protein